MSASYCRLCLKNDFWNSPLPIFENDVSLPLKIKELLGIELEQHDALPKVICHLCLAKVTFMTDFHQQVKSSVGLLHSLLGFRDVQSVSPVQPEKNKEHKTIVIPEGSSSSRVTISQLPDLQVKPKTAATKKSLPEPERVITSLSQTQPEKNKNDEDASSSHRKRGRPPVNKETAQLKLVRVPFKVKKDRLTVKQYKKPPKSVCCQFCNLPFRTLKGMRIHLSTCHLRKQKTDNLNRNEESNQNVSDDNVSQQDNNCNEKDDFKWCSKCDVVFLSDEDFKKHNRLNHNLPKKINRASRKKSVETCEEREAKKTDSTEVIGASNDSLRSFKNKNISSVQQSNVLPDVDSAENSDNLKGKNKVNKKSFENSLTDESSSKRIKSSLGKIILNCWKCKGAFNNYQSLFTHTCISQVKENSVGNSNVSSNHIENSSVDSDYIDVENNYDSYLKVTESLNDPLSLNSNDDVDQNDKTPPLPPDPEEISSEVISSNKAYGEMEIENEVNVTESPDSVFVPESTSFSYYQGRIDHKLINERVEKSTASCDVIDLEITSSSYKDTEITKLHSLESEGSSKLDSEKICNECGETFSCMKQLVHHKRVHKGHLSTYYRFSLGKT